MTNDTPPASPLPQRNIVDLLEQAGVSWKAYMEGYGKEDWKEIWKQKEYPKEEQPRLSDPPDPPVPGLGLARYFRKHNAFASFHTVQAVKERWEKIVGEVEFWQDAAHGDLPKYAWFTPDIWNDGHYLPNTHIDTNPRSQLVPQISTWLEHVFFGSVPADKGKTGLETVGLNLDIDLLLTDRKAAWEKSSIPTGTLVVVTFDEADYDAKGFETMYDGPNQIYTVLLGSMIEPGTVDATPYNHYSLVKTCQRNWGLGNLGKNDRDANCIRALWDESFVWGSPVDTRLSGQGGLALAWLGDGYHLIANDGTGKLESTTFDGQSWSAMEDTRLRARGPIASAAIEGTQFLVFTDDNEELLVATGEGAGWSRPEPLGYKAKAGLALASYVDEGEQGSATKNARDIEKTKLMLCWAGEHGFIKYLVFADDGWQKPARDVGQLTDGAMTLAQFGPSLFLVYKQRNSRNMAITSYNVAPFNAFKARDFEGNPAPENNTSLHDWAASIWKVGHFALKMAALQNNYEAIGPLAMASIEGEMHLVHRGGRTGLPHAYTECFGLTGILTAENAESNGYGTLDQAGWTEEEELGDMKLDSTSGIALASDGARLLMVWQEAAGNVLRYRTGRHETSLLGMEKEE